MKYIVKKIMEPDYGCEERPDDYVAMDKVLFRDENGSEIDMEIADKELYGTCPFYMWIGRGKDAES